MNNNLKNAIIKPLNPLLFVHIIISNRVINMRRGYILIGERIKHINNKEDVVRRNNFLFVVNEK